MSAVDLSVFKKYDVRGRFPNQVNPRFAHTLGQAFAKFLRQKNPVKKLTLVVGRDMRLSSPQLSSALIQGLIGQGINVVDIGLSSTPTFYFAVAYYKYSGGLQVSASHNPKDDNGFKLVLDKAAPISADTGLSDIKNIFCQNHFQPAPRPGRLSSLTAILPDLLASQTQEWGIDFAQIKPLKIVLDPANAMGVVDLDYFFRKIPAQIIKINFKLDGGFPSHPADPLVEENLNQLKKAVLRHQADLGIATDGDNDRVFFIDDQGQTVSQPILRGLMAQIVLRQYPGAPIGYDIRPGRITRDLITQAGGRPIVTPVGHTLIKQIMINHNAPFAGESSGHYFFKFSYGSFEAPFVLIAKFLQYISQQNKPLSQILAPYQIYFHSGEINLEVTDIPAKINQVKQKYSDGRLNLLDGLTVEYDQWWFNLRASNTEPKIRLNLEAKSQQLMEQKRDEILTLLRS